MPDPITGVYGPKLVDYPFLADCPVIALGGGNGALTFPITTGDDCLVFFNDRDIDSWFSGSSTSAPATLRLHSFSDGIILVGLRSLNNVLVNYSGSNVELRTKDGLTKISIAGDGSKITVKAGPLMTFEVDATGKFKLTNAFGEFVATLTDLLTAIQGGTVLGLPLVLPPNFATDLLILESFKV